MVGNREHLDHAAHISIDDRKRKAQKADLTNVGRAGDLEPVRSFDHSTDGLHCGEVIPAAQTATAFFVVGDLLFMLQRRFWMKPIGHLRRA